MRKRLTGGVPVGVPLPQGAVYWNARAGAWHYYHHGEHLDSDPDLKVMRRRWPLALVHVEAQAFVPNILAGIEATA